MYKPSRLNFVVIPLIGVLGVLYAAYATEIMRPKGTRHPPLSPPPQRTFEGAIAAVGMIEPVSESIEIAPRTPGVIASVLVSAGSKVRKGDPLFVLDGTDLAAELALREAGVRLAHARLERLRNSPRREEVLVKDAAVTQALAAVDDAKRKLDLIDKVPQGAVSQDERVARLGALEIATASHRAAMTDLKLLTAGSWDQDIEIAEQELALAQAGVARVRADIARLTSHAPIDGVILRSTARVGQFASAQGDQPLMILGDTRVLHVRVDINETDGPKASPAAPATAALRGSAGTTYPLTFVRAEPLVIPKRTLTGDAPERVDTRVLQFIYAFAQPPDFAYVGQIADVYIQTRPEEDRPTLASPAASLTYP